MDLTLRTLEGNHVRLEPLTPGHLESLCAVGLDAELWKFTTTIIRTRDEMRAYVEEALQWQAARTALPFATVERNSGRVVGSTRFANIDEKHLRAEIGWTWIAKPWQRTAVNTEAKYLMLRHAFEILGCMRIELKTDATNEKSRAAIRRIGGVEEGTFRKHMVAPGGRIRNTVYYSILDTEWPDVKKRLVRMMER